MESIPIHTKHSQFSTENGQDFLLAWKTCVKLIIASRPINTARQYVGPHRWDSSAKYFNFLEVSAWWTFPIYERCLALTYKPIPLAFTEEKQVIDMHCEIFHINNEYKPKIKFSQHLIKFFYIPPTGGNSRLIHPCPLFDGSSLSSD